MAIVRKPRTTRHRTRRVASVLLAMLGAALFVGLATPSYAAPAVSLEEFPYTIKGNVRAEGEPLPEWHYLVCGDRDAVHRAGESIVGWTVSEDVAGSLENHLVERVV